MSGPRVSVIVPMYQSGATVGETVRWALADLDASGLSGGLGEVVVVDDGSRDDGPRIVAGLAKEDGRVRMIRQANRGLAGARNSGLEAARAAGGWVRFIDADDLPTPGSTGRLIEVAEGAGVDAACGSHHLIDESGGAMGRVSSVAPGKDGLIGLDDLLCANRMGVGTVVVRRERLGPVRFDERLRVCEDWDLWLRLAESGLRWAVAPAWGGPMKLYRVRGGSLSKNFERMLEVGTDVVRRAFSRLGRGDDPRCGRAVRGQALAFASMRAVSEEPGAVGRAAAMLPSAEGFTSAQLAEAGVWGVLLGLGRSPEVGGRERSRWLRQLGEWWGAIGAEVNPADLAWRVVSPRAVARACLERAAGVGGGPVVIVGAGHNGMMVIEEARRRGVAFTVRDEALAGGGANGRRFAFEPMLAPIGRGRAVVITPERDDGLVDRLRGVAAKGVGIVRWVGVRGELAGPVRAEIESAGGSAALAA
ncbi:MAG: glycosyltransferase family 2 protein [Phycisphaerales bacterium]